MKLKETLAVGQDFQGVLGPGLGIGNCAAGLEQHVDGCPPDPEAIVAFLEAYLQDTH